MMELAETRQLFNLFKNAPGEARECASVPKEKHICALQHIRRRVNLHMRARARVYFIRHRRALTTTKTTHTHTLTHANMQAMRLRSMACFKCIRFILFTFVGMRHTNCMGLPKQARTVGWMEVAELDRRLFLEGLARLCMLSGSRTGCCIRLHARARSNIHTRTQNTHTFMHQ